MIRKIRRARRAPVVNDVVAKIHDAARRFLRTAERRMTIPARGNQIVMQRDVAAQIPVGRRHRMRPLAMETAVQGLANDAPLQREIPAAPQVVRSVDRPTQRAMVKNHSVDIVRDHGVVAALCAHRLIFVPQPKTHVAHHHVVRLLHLKRIVAQRDPIARRGLPRNRHKRFIEQQCALQQNRPRHLEHDRPWSLRRPDPFSQRAGPRIRQRRDVVNVSTPPALCDTPEALRPRKRRQLRRASRLRKPSAQHQGISKKAGNPHSQINCHHSAHPSQREPRITFPPQPPHAPPTTAHSSLVIIH